MDVPHKLWSVVIGASGANIRRIESSTGARLQLEQDPQPHLKIQVCVLCPCLNPNLEPRTPNP
jgi:transcription antitermination factor NusA-like protein